jgi:enoyl-CoA hydratase/carnithine racemase
VERNELDTVIYEKEGPIARIILNRPEKANAQNSRMVWDVDNCLTDAERDYDVKVLILKANGKGFCAGHDTMPGTEMAERFPEFAAAHAAGHPWKGSSDLFTWPVLHLWEFLKPSISAVHGYAIGGGSYFALIPDVVVASDDAYFQMPLVQGLGFPGAETTIEPWVLMNFHRAYEYLYLAKTVDAAEAERIGMVNRVVPPEHLDETVEVMARQIAQAPLSTLMGVKSLVKRVWEGMGMRTHLQTSVEVMELVGAAGDVIAWRKENAEKGYGPGVRQVVEQRKAAAEAEYRNHRSHA